MEENLHEDGKTSISFCRENRMQALIQERGDMCMTMADACWSMAETNTIL